MNRNYVSALAGALFCLLATNLSFGQIVFDEANDGELSNNGATPTALTFNLGANTIVGSFGSNGQSGANNGNDADVFTFNLGPNLIVDSISTTRDGTARSFFGYSNSATATLASDNTNNFDAGGLFANGESATASLSTFDPASGLSPIESVLPLGSGDHSFFFQETAAGEFNYSVTFNVVSSVPEPSSTALLILGLAGVATRRRKRA